MKPALIVFAKPPEPGRVKTRLTPDLTEREAADLYAAFLQDVLEQVAGLGVDIRLYESDAIGEAVAVPDRFARLRQRGAGLGARMLNAFTESFAEGYRRLVIVGTDHPTLPLSFVELAFEALNEPRSVVVGPATDGGYYLLGMNDLRPTLFRDMTYGHARVLEETLNRIRSTSASLAVLPEWYDVDTPDALRRLAGELRHDPSQAPNTSEVLRRLAPNHPWLSG